MSNNTEDHVIVRLLERTTNVMNAQAPEDAARLMMNFIHHAAHIAKSLTDSDTICGYLTALADHLPECTEHTSVEREEVGTAVYPKSTTKH